MPKLALGVDFGTSGVRIAVNDLTGDTLFECGSPYPGPFEWPETWRKGFIALILQIPLELRERLGALALAGTSGTLLLCRPDGSLPGAELSSALPNHHACSGQQARPFPIIRPVRSTCLMCGVSWAQPPIPQVKPVAVWPGPFACWSGVEPAGTPQIG